MVEKWIPPRGKMKFGVRKDVWGFADLLACKPSAPLPSDGSKSLEMSKPAIALIQTFPLARWNDHAVKLSGIPAVHTWKDSGGLVILHGWAFKPKDGIRGNKKVWTCREEVL